MLEQTNRELESKAEALARANAGPSRSRRLVGGRPFSPSQKDEFI
jgi:hypothetical protein